jgi:RND family efflux transporter MFP subunit
MSASLNTEDNLEVKTAKQSGTTSRLDPDTNQAHRTFGKRGGGLRIILMVVMIAAATVAVIQWRRSHAFGTLASETHEMAVPEVTVVSPHAGPTETEIVLPGNLTAYSDASIYARTNGYLKAWYTDIGAKVKEGELMAEIEAPDLDAQDRQSGANLAQARANLEIAKLTFAREQDLLRKNVISQEEFDQSRTTMDAQVAAVNAGEANLQNLQAQEGFKKITAPFTGVVTRRNTDVGSLINAGSSATSPSAQELFHVERTDILRVYVYVPQIYSSMLTLDSPAYLDLQEFPGVKFQGKIAHIAGAIDPATRTLQTEVDVPNADGRLFPGAYANVHLVMHSNNVPVVLPENTVLFRSQGTQVAVVGADGTVHLKDVTIGRDFGTSLEVLDGVASNDRVIVNPSDSLAEGAKVDVQK